MNQKSAILPWNVLLGISVFAMVGILIYHLATPMPKFRFTGEAVAEQETKVRKQAQSLYQEVLESEKFAFERMWTGKSDEVGPVTLEATTAVANRLGIKLSAFRPQKQITEGATIRLPFLVSIEGTYPKVVEFVREMELPIHKIVVHVVQMSSTDGSSSAVNAVIGLWAFQKAPPKIKAKKGKVNA